MVGKVLRVVPYLKLKHCVTSIFLINETQGRNSQTQQSTVKHNAIFGELVNWQTRTHQVFETSVEVNCVFITDHIPFNDNISVSGCVYSLEDYLNTNNLSVSHS